MIAFAVGKKFPAIIIRKITYNGLVVTKSVNGFAFVLLVFFCLFFIRGCIIFWRCCKRKVLICYLTKTLHLRMVLKRLLGSDSEVIRTLFDFTLPNSKNRLCTERRTQIIAVKDATKAVAN